MAPFLWHWVFGAWPQLRWSGWFSVKIRFFHDFGQSQRLLAIDSSWLWRQVVPNTERLVSLISEQFLTITGNVTALADPKLHRYRLASAAAARHAALVTRRYARERRAEEPEDLRLEELDPSFCEAAPQFLQIKNESRNMDEFDFVNDCCEPTKFDSLGNEQCFPEWPSWPVRICCAHHLSQGPSKSSYFAGFWRTLAWSIFESTQSIDEPPIAFESHVKSIMAYHKSGVSLSTELVGNVAPGPLTRFLLKNPEETVMVPHDFQVTCMATSDQS